MRTLAFDGRTGASGDMLLGALVAAGADPDALAPVEDALPLSYRVREVDKQGITATAVDVVLDDREGHSRDDSGGHTHGHDHGGDSHDHHHDDDHAHDHTHAEGHGPQRSYPEVRSILDGMALPAGVVADARAIFEILGEAEAAVHGTDLESTHFHEVGADDAIADVVGVCLLLADLGVERVLTTPLSTGGGTVEMSHGTYPVPVPAVVEIAERADWSLQGGPVERELLTPTGAAILAHFAEGVETLPALEIESSGYGAGGYGLDGIPNVLRAMVGSHGSSLRTEAIRVLETNLDDASPEILGDLQTSLREAGARDVSVVPLTMKKGRPGHLVKVVVRPEDTERVARRLAEETGTLGVREHGAGHRWVAERSFATATLLEDGERYPVDVKVASDSEGTRYDVSAEFDDAAAVARETGLPTREVMRRAEAAVHDGHADRLLHIVEGEVETDAPYAPPSLEREGFVHCSTPEQVLGVVRAHYADAESLGVLVVDPERVAAEIRYEEQPDGRAYPHVFGPLHPDAILEVRDLPHEDGAFVLPADLE